jgi:hypothetical protein
MQLSKVLCCFERARDVKTKSAGTVLVEVTPTVQNCVFPEVPVSEQNRTFNQSVAPAEI